jgi:hypothetical protein
MLQNQNNDFYYLLMNSAPYTEKKLAYSWGKKVAERSKKKKNIYPNQPLFTPINPDTFY